MAINKYDLEYLEIDSKRKPIFIFVNHKTALVCWAKIGKQINKKPNVITFDSHGDFRGGLINGEQPTIRESHFGSKYVSHLKHFTKCKEFMNWDISDNEQNIKFVEQEKKFLLMTNDNFIDAAFMKDIISNVYWYFLNHSGNAKSGKCDDFNDKNHLFVRSDVKKFKHPSKPFILDIDLDFFVKYYDRYDCESVPVSDVKIKRYLSLQKELFLNPLCRGLTIAIEPSG